MNLIAPPAFTDHPNRMPRDGGSARVVDTAALDAQQRVLATILVTHHRAGPPPADPAAASAATRPWKNALR
jgi:hypothetical protein